MITNGAENIQERVAIYAGVSSHEHRENMELRCFAAAFILVLIIKNAVATEDVAFRKWLWRGLTQFFLHPWEVSANGIIPGSF